MEANLTVTEVSKRRSKTSLVDRDATVLSLFNAGKSPSHIAKDLRTSGSNITQSLLRLNESNKINYKPRKRSKNNIIKEVDTILAPVISEEKLPFPIRINNITIVATSNQLATISFPKEGGIAIDIK